jgi:hypothetical protein
MAFKVCSSCGKQVREIDSHCWNCESVEFQTARTIPAKISEITTKKCPFCGKEIQDEALKCCHCGRKVAASRAEWTGALIFGAVMIGVIVMIGLNLDSFLDMFSASNSAVATSKPAAPSSPKPVATDGTAFEDICENWFYYRDRTLRLARAGDEEGAAKARKQFEQNDRWLADYPGRTLPATKSGCR